MPENEAKPPLLHWTFFVHLWTLTGVALAVYALERIFQNDFDTAARCLVFILVIDFTDGTLARGFKVKERMPLIDGAIIDYIHDLVGLTFVPMVFYHRVGLFLPEFSLPLVIAATCAAVLKYSMKENLLKLGYSIGAPPIFISVFLCYFLQLPQLWSTIYAAFILFMTLLPFRLPITSIVTTHWKFGWKSITNYLFALSVIPILIMLKNTPPVILWILFANIMFQITVMPLLLSCGVVKPGFDREY